MGNPLNSATVAFLAAAEGTEQAELQQPWEAVIAQGGRPVLVSPAQGKIQMFEHLDEGDTMPVDVHVGDARVADYVGLVLPGGVANPDQLRTDPAAVAFARSFFEAGKPVAAVCHAPWTLIEAGVVSGRTLTSRLMAPAAASLLNPARYASAVLAGIGPAPAAAHPL